MSAARPLRGARFPLRPDARGRMPYCDGADLIQQSILLILLTRPGERPLRPRFGCGLDRYLMQPNNVTTRALIQQDIERALSRWEPRVDLGEVRVEPGDDPALVVIDISYTHAGDGRPGTLQFPLYLE